MSGKAITLEEAGEHLEQLRHRVRILCRLQTVLRDRFKPHDGQPPIELIPDDNGGSVEACPSVVSAIEYEIGDAVRDALEQMESLRRMKLRRSTMPRLRRALER
jgi:hypothetical protein